MFQCNELNPVKIQLPAWRPGRYELQNYAKNIIDFVVKDAKNNPIRHKNIDLNSWEIYPTQKGDIHIQYYFFAKQLDAGGSWVTIQLIYLNFINFLVYIIDYECNIGISVAVEISKNFQICCAMPNKRIEKFCFFEAKNYLQLADSPLVASEKIITIDIFYDNKHFIYIFMENKCKYFKI